MRRGLASIVAVALIAVAFLAGCGGAASTAGPTDSVRSLVTPPGSSAPAGPPTPGPSAWPSLPPGPGASPSAWPSLPPGPGASPSAGPSLPPTPDGPVPADLQPSLAAAAESCPATYRDGCNVPEGGRASHGSCLYADLRSATTIVLFGDSHAAFWFAPVEAFAAREGWRLLNLTMSSCTPADLSTYNSIFKRVYVECPAWREQAIARIVALHPAVALVGGTHGIDPVDASGNLLPGDAITSAWKAGMTRTVDLLVPAAGRVILIADTPTSRVDPPVCLAAHPASLLACATPVAEAVDAPWLAAEREVVGRTGVGFIDPTWWVCPPSPCPVAVGRLLVYQNGGHLTVPFAASLTDRLGAAILGQMR